MPGFVLSLFLNFFAKTKAFVLIKLFLYQEKSLLIKKCGSNHIRVFRVLWNIFQPAHDVPGTYLKGPLKVLTSGTYRGPSEDSQGIKTKIDNLMKKMFFRSISPCSTHLFLFFKGTTNFQTFKTGTSRGRLRDPVAGRPWHQMMGRSTDVRGTSAILVFLNSTYKHIKLTLTGYSRLYREWQ